MMSTVPMIRFEQEKSWKTLGFHLWYNSFDQGFDGKKAADRFGDLVCKKIAKFKPHKNAICKISK